MKKVLVLAILALSLSSCETKPKVEPKICLTCVAFSWKDESQYPLAGFPAYGKGNPADNYELCNQDKDSKDVVKIRERVRHIYINNVGYKITRTEIFDCNPKK
jgi:hypothetical protein